MNKTKLESYTSLFGTELVKKNHPRIVLRGKLDTLTASFLTTSLIVKQMKDEKLYAYLKECCQYMSKIVSAETRDKLLESIKLFGLNEAEIRELSHSPKKHMGIDHLFNINPEMNAAVIILNQLRVEIRESEVASVRLLDYIERYNDKTENEVVESIIKGLNRLSSAVYILMCMKASDNTEVVYKK